MEILGFNRVELIVGEDQIDDAVRQFNDLLGLRLPQPHAIEGQPVLSATDFPHPATTWPNSRAVVERQFAGIPDDERQLICAGNAARLYNL